MLTCLLYCAIAFCTYEYLRDKEEVQKAHKEFNLSPIKGRYALYILCVLWPIVAIFGLASAIIHLFVEFF